MQVPSLHRKPEGEAPQEQENDRIGIGLGGFTNRPEPERGNQHDWQQGSGGNRNGFGRPPGSHQQHQPQRRPGFRGHGFRRWEYDGCQQKGSPEDQSNDLAAGQPLGLFVSVELFGHTVLFHHSDIQHQQAGETSERLKLAIMKTPEQDKSQNGAGQGPGHIRLGIPDVALCAQKGLGRFVTEQGHPPFNQLVKGA